MQPISKSFNARSNADWAEDIQFQQAGAPLDLTGADVRMSIVDWNGRTSLSLTLGHGLSLDGSSGTLSIRVPALTMQGLSPGSYKHDIQVRLGGGITVPIEGALTIARGVTRV